MLICVPDVLSKTDVAEFRRIMDASVWEDGRSTAGAQSALVKRNEQLPPDSEVARATLDEVAGITSDDAGVHIALRASEVPSVRGTLDISVVAAGERTRARLAGRGRGGGLHHPQPGL